MWLQALVGISVVFLALIALSFCIYLFGKIMSKDYSKKKEESFKTVTEDVKETKELENDDELVAVITAAVQAYMGTSKLDPECKIRVKSFKRVISEAPIWNTTNRRELVN